MQTIPLVTTDTQHLQPIQVQDRTNGAKATDFEQLELSWSFSPNLETDLSANLRLARLFWEQLASSYNGAQRFAEIVLKEGAARVQASIRATESGGLSDRRARLGDMVYAFSMTDPGKGAVSELIAMLTNRGRQTLSPELAYQELDLNPIRNLELPRPISLCGACSLSDLSRVSQPLGGADLLVWINSSIHESINTSPLNKLVSRTIARDLEIDSITIGSYNIRSMPFWFLPLPARQLNHWGIRREIERIEPDILMLQEAWSLLCREKLFMSRNKYQVHYGDSLLHTLSFMGANGLATLLKRGCSMNEQKVISFDERPGHERLVRKGFSYAEVVLSPTLAKVFGTESIAVINTHLASPLATKATCLGRVFDPEDPLRLESRSKQRRQISTFVAENVPESQPLLIVGDFNSLEAEDVANRDLNELAGAVDLFRLRMPLTLRDSCHQLNHEEQRYVAGATMDPTRNWSARNGLPHPARLDRIYLRLPPEQWLNLAIAVNVKEIPHSDHYPLVSTLVKYRYKHYP